MTFGGEAPRLFRPRASKPGVATIRRALSEGVARDGGSPSSALSQALGQLRRVARQPGLVAIVSDFREQHGWTSPLGALRATHSVLGVEVRDPREGEVPAVGHLALVDPETGERVEVDTSSRTVRHAFFRIEAERRTQVARELRRLRVEHVVLSTQDDWLRELGRSLR
jgi:uncharacterized protein (DUF58 family)